MQSKTYKQIALNIDKSPFIINDLKDDTGFLMLQVSNLWGNNHERALKKYHGLTHMQYAILASVSWLVYKCNIQVTQSILAQHTKINPMTISQIFKVLEAKGFIFRTKHPTDIRSKVVHLTPEANDIIHKAFHTIWDVDAKFFNDIKEQQEQFNQCLYNLLKAND